MSFVRASLSRRLSACVTFVCVRALSFSLAAPFRFVDSFFFYFRYTILCSLFLYFRRPPRFVVRGGRAYVFRSRVSFAPAECLCDVRLCASAFVFARRAVFVSFELFYLLKKKLNLCDYFSFTHPFVRCARPCCARSAAIAPPRRCTTCLLFSLSVPISIRAS
jgi:hypothetical protein